MATQIVPAPECADHPASALSAADRAAHAAASLVRVPADTATRLQSATDRYVALAADGDYDGCLAVCDEMTMCLRQLALASGSDLIRAA